MHIEAALGAFFLEFSQFETHGVTRVLRALSKDDTFVAQAESLLGLEARLTLLERLAFARAIPGDLMTELMALSSRTRTLRDQRDDLARMLDSHRLDKPGVGRAPSLPQIEAYVVEAVELQQGFSTIAANVDSHLKLQLLRSPRFVS